MSMITVYRKRPRKTSNNRKVDIVYTWVDSSDQTFRDIFQQHTKKAPSNIRYRSYNEISYSIRLLNKYCKWYNNIYIVTAFGQQPDDFDELKKLCNNKLFIIDHKQIFDKNVTYPTFNSCVIETYLHKIPGLTEYFLYFNDDMFFGREIKQSDFFINGKGIIDLQPTSFPNRNNPIKLKKNPYEAHNLNANILATQKYTQFHSDRVHHYPTLCSIKACGIAHELFKKEILAHVKMRTRTIHNIAFILLQGLVGLREGIFKRRLDNSLSRMYIRGFVFDKLYATKPHLFCINHLDGLNDQQIKVYHETMKKYCEEN